MIIKKIFYPIYDFICCKRKKQNIETESESESFNLPFPPHSSHELTTYYVMSNEEENPPIPNYPVNLSFIKNNFPSLLNPVIYPTNNQIDFIPDIEIDNNIYSNTNSNYSPSNNTNSTNSTNSNKNRIISDDEMIEILDRLKHQNDDLVKLINTNLNSKF